ncbi:MAG TPA: nucleotide disphospho-sugar-binding domain-containing protein [Steroidobacteraceae bacterium]|nr:nucleotide disphospho-sugar-binding domain-containing protein [Steroidobacteraceae bacterium]
MIDRAGAAHELTAPPARSLRVLLPTLGSAGDVHPFVALALALRARGHRPMIVTNPLFAPLIERLGLEFLPVGTVENARRLIGDPDLWHPRRGLGLVVRDVILPSVEPVYRLIEAQADAATVVAASSIALGARVAQERLGIPTASVHLQPAVLRSVVDQGTLGPLRISARQPMWLKRAAFHLLDRLVIDRLLTGPLNEFRGGLGLACVDRPFAQWMHSPQRVIGFFPAWYAPPQPDWPPQTRLVGFPLWDGADGAAPMPSAAQRFLDDGAPPLVFTAGSAAATMTGFFAASAQAAERLGRRAMLITNHAGQLPRQLPAGVQAFDYLPFSAVLPRAALVVHHGGIGTVAQALHAAVPQLVVANAHDQFDNAFRVERLGVGRSLARRRYSAARAARAIGSLLDDPATRRHSQECRGWIDSAAALDRACDLIERLPLA